MVFLNRFILRQDMEVTMEKVWIRYKGFYILRLSDTSWGINYDTGGRCWQLQVYDSLDKALRWIDGN